MCEAANAMFTFGVVRKSPANCLAQTILFHIRRAFNAITGSLLDTISAPCKKFAYFLTSLTFPPTTKSKKATVTNWPQ